MQNEQYDEETGVVSALLKRAEALENGPTGIFGYADRILIERCLFSLLKQVCATRLGYQLQGLGEVHRKALLAVPCDAELKRVIKDAFELRVFMQAVTSGNPYVRNEALSNAGLLRKQSTRTIAAHIRKLVERAQIASSTRTPPPV